MAESFADAQMTKFFSWTEENEDLPFQVVFEEVAGSKLLFQIDEVSCKLVLKPEFSISCSHGVGSVRDEFESNANSWLSEQVVGSTDLTEILDNLAQFYREANGDGDGAGDLDNDLEFDEEEDEIDYRAMIDNDQEAEQFLDAANLNRDRMGGATNHDQGIVKMFRHHFVCREAQDAISLVHQNSDQLRNGMRVVVIPDLLLVKLEIELSFLDISESSLRMLGLTFEEPLAINLILGEQKLMVNESCSDWNLSILNGFAIEASQGSVKDSFGCKEYTGRLVRKYFEVIKDQLRNDEYCPDMVLSRGSSEVEEKKSGKSDNLYSKVKSALTTSKKKKVKVDDAQLKKLLEIGYNRADCVEALEVNNNDIELAAAYLDDKFNEYIREEQLKLKKQSSITKSKNFFWNLLFFVKDKLQNCPNYCIICQDKHVADSIRLRPCTKDLCQFSFEENIGASIYAEFNNNPDLGFFDLSLASHAIFSARTLQVFEPFPSFFLKSSEIRSKAGWFSANDTSGENSNRNVSGAARTQQQNEAESNKDMTKLREIFVKIPKLDQLIAASHDEASLRENILSLAPQLEDGHLVYKLIRYILATNRLSLIKLENDDRIKGLDANIGQFIVSNHSPEKEEIFALEKKKHGSFWAYHGSSLENWYSILRNGLRNLSNTHLMTAGAAYGQGIYAGLDLSTSYGYSCRRPYYNAGTTATAAKEWDHSMFNAPQKVALAIIEVINIDSYKKGGTICTIPNENHVTIRYMLVIPTNVSNTAVKADSLGLEKHFSTFIRKIREQEKIVKERRIQRSVDLYMQRKKEEESVERLRKDKEMREIEERTMNELNQEQATALEKLENSLSGKGSAAANKRIMVEYKQLMTSKETSHISINFKDDSNMYIWHATIDAAKCDLSKELKQDFDTYAKKYNKAKEFVFEVHFSKDFPFFPPFIRVVRPRFAFHTGHITIGGSICMESLTPSGWTVARNLESLFIEILSNMFHGGGRLEINTPSANVDYTLEEARDAFQRVAKYHNWI
mmetsp:Transcript_52064/g.59470  ORF Transcript_52064/g.59470 Transcript_52064/m.59470 type:complete len:1019 (+) Transcript_52064:116-3172(+)